MICSASFERGRREEALCSCTIMYMCVVVYGLWNPSLQGVNKNLLFIIHEVMFKSSFFIGARNSFRKNITNLRFFSHSSNINTQLTVLTMDNLNAGI